MKYLEVHPDRRLNFLTHIDKLINLSLIKANGTISILYTLLATKSKLSTQNKIKIYKTIIRPVITAPDWCSISNSTMLRLQRFQNKYWKLATNSNRYTKIIDLHKIINTELLKTYIDRLSDKFCRFRISMTTNFNI